MTVSVQWNNASQTVMRFEFQPPWEWSDFHDAVLDSHVLLNQIEHPVVRIFDVRSYKHLSTDTLQEAKHCQEKLHPNFHPMVVVLGDKSLARSTLGELFSGVFRHRPNFHMVFTSSLEDAIAKSEAVFAPNSTG